MTLFPDIIGESLAMDAFYPNEEQALAENWQVEHRHFLRPRCTFGLGWSFLSDADKASIETHIQSNSGAFQSFPWYAWDERFYWTWVRIGIGDGVTTLFTLPVTQSSDQSFSYASGNGVITNIAGGSATMSLGTGTDGADRVTFAVAPPANSRIFASFRGRRQFTVTHGSDDNAPTRDLETGLWMFSHKLIQVRGANG